MFPIRDDNPQVNTPYVTYAIVVLNALAWFGLQGMGAEQQLNASICHYGLIPADLFADSMANAQMGVCGDIGSGWMGAVSSMFMHGGWMHILGNMWFLWVFGDNVEDSMGSVRFAIFYVLCGLAAAAAQALSDPGSTTPMVGASGAIGGVMGAYIVLYPRVKVHMFVMIFVVRIPAIAMLGYWFAMQVFSGITSIGATGGGVAFWAHIGGFIAGALLVMVFKDQELLLNHPYHGWKKSQNPADVWNDPSNRQ